MEQPVICQVFEWCVRLELLVSSFHVAVGEAETIAILLANQGNDFRPGSERQIVPAGRVQVHEDAKVEADHAVPTVHILLESLCERDCNG